jgi:hypothetical protein
MLVFRAAAVGLANRLRALVGYQAMSRLLGVPFRLEWVADDACNASFSSLFEPTRDVSDGPGPASIFTWSPWFGEIWERHLCQRFERGAFMAEVRAALRALRPAPDVRGRIAAFVGGRDLSRTVGVHIRLTDNVAAYPYWERVDPSFVRGQASTLEGFLSVLDLATREGTAFLATDNPRVEELCRRRYGQRLLTYGKQYTLASGRTSSIVDALVELAVLAACPQVVGTYFSSFSQFAAVWGGADYREVHGTECRRSPFVDAVQAELAAG